ncbi:MAG: alpha-amylase [Chloroflexi bacterium]|nr:alpha-amylase [Chloroflexota bacterium]
MATFEFHVSRRARDRYALDDALFSLTGNVVFANFRAARVFAQKMNEQRDLVNFPERAVKPGQINAMGLVDEILHYLVATYRQENGADVMARALAHLEERIGREALDKTLRQFADSFPSVAVYRRETPLDEYLAGQTGETPNRQIVLEELLLLWLANVNPAFSPFTELFDDGELRQTTAYARVVRELQAFFDGQPAFGPEQQNLIAELRAPAIAVPHSLEGQLSYILERWGSVLGRYVYRLLSSLDVIKEERKLIFLGPGPMQVPVYDATSLSGGFGADGQPEPEAFSSELSWMPSLVLMAKNTYVWLDQLSKKYGRLIDRLDQIPDEELAQLQRWGVTGLWLIGVWERSPASQRIKVMCGNPDAVPSAYSLYDYVIAHDLGGEAAYADLKARSWSHGIRMASDMVPNHVGIVSKWVIEHPDWFVWREDNPYPWYTYGGPDLSNDDRIAIHIEDHYYDRTDAAVTFKRIDRHSGQERYIYHGNDGTSMPWNDTAQLNYLNPEVREAVIQTILHVARQFPVIRFDAAMTLAKRHFQRLWFPEPGTGGAIPTRAEVGMTRDDFNAAMPAEFWREVVDRVAAEAPDTLLLAEAFWLLEGYFVRTLGMHRVYNSAFMVMLRDEDNAKYRRVMKNTLEFDPEVLRRFVNFMNNPDERTAIDQFGNGDKYFGVCTLMVTMPGLPMLGHGQIEGFAEKYGMEFRRPLWDETPDRALIERHEREIFPLMRQRPLFAGVEHFLLYDFYRTDGNVDEDVFAFSNRLGDERALVVYNNRWGDTRGWVKSSAAFAQRTGQGDEKSLVQRTLAEGLGLEAGDDWYSIARDQVTGLEYIRGNRQLRDEGLYIELGAYRRAVLVGFRQVQDTHYGQYGQLAAYLEGRGVPSIDEAMREIRLQPIQRPFSALVNPQLLRRLLVAETSGPGPGVDLDADLFNEVEMRLRDFLTESRHLDAAEGDLEAVVRSASAYLGGVLGLLAQAAHPEAEPADVDDDDLLAAEDEAEAEAIGATGQSNGIAERGAAADLEAVLDALEADEPDEPSAGQAAAELFRNRPEAQAALLIWALTRSLGELLDAEQPAEHSRALFDEWMLAGPVERAFQGLGLDDGAAMIGVGLVRVLLAHERALVDAGSRSPRAVMERLLADADVRDFLGVNRYRDVLWFTQERFDALVAGLLATAIVTLTVEAVAEGGDEATADGPVLDAVDGLARTLWNAEERSGYQVERLLLLLSA